MKIGEYYKKILPTHIGLTMGLILNVILFRIMEGAEAALVFLFLEYSYISIYWSLYPKKLHDYINKILKKMKIKEN